MDDEVVLDTARGIDSRRSTGAVGYLFQEYALFPHLDVAANVRFGARAGADVQPLLERFRIGELARRASTSSRAASASGSRSRAPSGATRRCCSSTSRSRRSTRTRGPACAPNCESSSTRSRLPTLLVTHDFEDAATLAHRVGVISEGAGAAARHAHRARRSPERRVRRELHGGDGAARSGGRGARRAHARRARRRCLGVELGPASGPVNVAVYPWDVSVGTASPTTRA